MITKAIDERVVGQNTAEFTAQFCYYACNDRETENIYSHETGNGSISLHAAGLVGNS